MAQNSLVKQNADKVVEYECNGNKVKLTPNIIRQYLVSGGGDVSDQEIVMFLNLCRYQKLNPFLREAYLIKFGNNPASMVTGKEVFTKRANRNKEYAGQQAGVVVQNASGAIENRIGALVLSNETLVGGWAKVYIKNYDVPIEISIGLSEYIGLKKDGEINQQWSKKPATMIRKVALVQALREAFPEEFQGLYSAEEMGADDTTLNVAPIENAEKLIAETEQPHTDDDPFKN